MSENGDYEVSEAALCFSAGEGGSPEVFQCKAFDARVIPPICAELESIMPPPCVAQFFPILGQPGPQ
jgi:hypothetical protein